MKQIYFILLAFTFCISCEDFLAEVDCDTCYSIKPEIGEIIIKASQDSKNPYIPIKIYEGKIERDILIHEDTLVNDETYIDGFETNKYYTVVAEYQSGDEIIYAVDGGRFYTDLVRGYCESSCYLYKGGIYNVELKYDGK